MQPFMKYEKNIINEGFDVNWNPPVNEVFIGNLPPEELEKKKQFTESPGGRALLQAARATKPLHDVLKQYGLEYAFMQIWKNQVIPLFHKLNDPRNLTVKPNQNPRVASMKNPGDMGRQSPSMTPNSQPKGIPTLQNTDFVDHHEQ